MSKKDEHIIRTLEGLEPGGVKTIVVERSLVDMFLEHNPEYQEKHNQLQAKKKKGELLPFPK